ncbi:MAG TPA: polyhydroxyalkanoate synthesis regulator DNA-binding domain-containing protein [Terracidiphilus sp.]|jgi:polyhydroxyalkanoate synthesis repressor PhaR|nr:polyhydroxyalkanoate synthesis regulator DNA-binding domain-containing protein [Terracidiphilus sp.]
MPAKTVLIKKYENRRLYDATNSRYINLEEVAGLVRSGFDVRVVDAASGEDITRVILTQIVAEGAKTPDSSFPLDILRQMVIASGRASQESALRYMKAMLDLYQSTYRAITPALNPFDFLQNASESTPPAMNNIDEIAVPAPAAANSTGSGEIRVLKDRLAELEKQIASLSARPTRRKPSRKKSQARSRK